MTSLAERLLAKVVQIPISGCWLWEGYLNPKTGYGEVHAFGRTETTHRAAYRAFCGDPGTLHVLHRCDVRCCLNPHHLFLGTNQDNIADSSAKGRRCGVPRKRPSGLQYAVPPGAHDVKLKIPRAVWSSIVQRIANGETQAQIALEYAVDPSTISNIKRRYLCG